MDALKGMIATAIMAGVVLLPATAAQAGGQMLFDANTQYSSFSDSPLFSFANTAGNSFWLEDFEDGLSNTAGLLLNTGEIRNPGDFTDSVDLDDGVLDGLGQAGHSWYISPEITGPDLIITFDQEVLGALPTIAGLVWTDGNPNATVTIVALGIEGETLGQLTTTIGDGLHMGSTAADRFIGAQFSQGIYQLVITASTGGLEIDHVQMGFEGVIIPLPPALALGVAGLGLVALRRRRSKNA